MINDVKFLQRWVLQKFHFVRVFLEVETNARKEESARRTSL